jgi:hypothetical protein
MEADMHLRRFGSILLKKDFEGGLREIFIQDGRPTSKIDSKTPLFGFYYFKFKFHSLILDTFSTVSATNGHMQCSKSDDCLPVDNNSLDYAVNA